MKITLVGASGFIGTRLISRLLAHGHDVTNLDLLPSATHPGLTVLGDVRDPDAVRAAIAGRDAVVLLAAQHRDDVRPISLYDEVNVGGARVVADAMAAEGVSRLVFTSTVAVYGLEVPHPDESTPTRPFNDYGRTKLLAEGVLERWADADPLRSLSVVRPCVVFGESNRGNVWTLAHQIDSGRFVMIGKGANRKSMAYVGNVAAFLTQLLEGAPAGRSVTNYADKPDLTTQALVALLTDGLGKAAPSRSLPPALAMAGGRALDVVARVTGRTLPISAVRVEKFVAETTISTERLDASGFVREFELQEGLRRTLAADFPRSGEHLTPA
jgi:nucleoside-diphosphate-sugar epimerase